MDKTPTRESKSTRQARFNDDQIRRGKCSLGDIPADAFALIHDIAYHHNGRDVYSYVTVAQNILRKRL